MDRSTKLNNVRASGLVGMAPSNQGIDDAPLFIDKMYEAGAVSERVYSLYITDCFNNVNSTAQDGSRIVIGGFDLNKFAKKGAKITWNPILNDLYWIVSLVKVSAESSGQNQIKSKKTNSYNFKTKSTKAIIDSGTSFVLMPVEDHYKLVSYLQLELDLQF